MRLAWLSDTTSRPVKTGFARASEPFLRYLHERGHEILECGVGWTGPHNPNPWPVVGTTHNGGRLEGQDIAPFAARDFRADILLAFADVPDMAWLVTYTDKHNHPLQEEAIETLDKREFAVALYAPIDGCLPDGTAPSGWSKLFRGMNAFDGFAAPSRFGASLMGEGGVWIPHALDTSFWNPQGLDRERCRDALGIPQDRFVLLYVATNRLRKAVPAFFEAVGKFMDRQPDAKAALLFIGQDREDHYDLDELSRAYRIESRGVLAHREQNLTDPGLKTVYGAADLLVFLSASEGFGLPLIEAQSLRLPVVATDYAAMSENVPPHERGFCRIPPKALVPQPNNNIMYAWPDTDVAAERIEAFYLDRGLRMRLRKAAFEFGQEFSITNVGPKMERFLLETVARKKAEGRRIRVEVL